MSPKLSSPPPRFKSESSSFGGVAVLAELAVIARSLAGEGVLCGCGCGGVGRRPDFAPKEKVRPAARREKNEDDSGTGGTGMS